MERRAQGAAGEEERNRYAGPQAGSPDIVDRAGPWYGPGWALLSSYFLGVFLGCDGADCFLHHHNRHSRGLRLFLGHVKRPELPRSAEEALPLEAEEAHQEIQFQCSEV